MFQYRKFVDAVYEAEAVEKETGMEIVKKYAAWTCFDFKDWKKLIIFSKLKLIITNTKENQ